MKKKFPLNRRYFENTGMRTIRIFLKLSLVFILIGINLKASEASGGISNPTVRFNTAGEQKQPETIKGKVVDVSGLPLPGVTVLVKGTSTGVVTDLYGEYSIEVPDLAAVLSFSYIGYVTKELAVEGRTVIDVTLETDIIDLSEIVVIGYGTARKVDLTGAVSSVNTKEISKMATPSVETALQGRAAGVYVTKNNGGPGEGASIFVRGPGSIGGSGPLWVVDGIPSEAGNTLDMSTIESIDILKDASGAAIYGAKGANGVILVTTKRGKSGKTKFGFSSYLSQNQAIKLPEMVNAMEYAQTKTQSQINAGMANKTTGLIPAAFYQEYAKGDSTYYFPDGTPIGEGTPWFDVLFKKGLTRNYNFNISGGTDVMNFYTSFDYLKEEGTALRSFFERYSLVFNSDYKLGKFITLGESVQLSMTDKSGADQIINEQMMRVNPFMPVMDPTRNLPAPYENFGILDPIIYDFDPPSHYGMTMVDNKSEKWYQMRSNVYVDINPTKGLSWRTSLGGILKNKNYNYYGERYDMGRYFRYDDRLEQSINYESNVSFNSVVTYNKLIGKHSFTLMAGSEVKTFHGNTMVARKDSFPVGLVTFDAGNINKTYLGGNYLEPEKWISYFSRLLYNYDDKYLFQANFRRDGCSNFGPNKRYGNFPSFSAAWRITNEPFMESLKSIMDLKIRGGWGVVGNSSIGAFRYLSTVNSSGIYYPLGLGPNQPYLQGASPNSFPNMEVHWEEYNTTNLGFDMGLFNSALIINAEIYSRINKGMLIPVDLPFSSGYYVPWSSGSTTINSGNVSNKGFEMAVTYHKRIGDLDFSVSGNLAYNRNKVEKLFADAAIIKGAWSQFVTEAGKPMSYYKGYVVDRIYQATPEDSAEILRIAKATNPSKYLWARRLAPGDFKYKDINGDSIINDKDRVQIGNPWPKYVYGLNLTANYKGLDLTVFIQGVIGNDIYATQKRYWDTFTGDYTPTKNILDSWTPENPNTEIPRLNYKDPNRNFTNSSSYFIEKGDYLRLKNIQLGYTFPQKIQNFVKLTNFRIYASAQNLFTITKYPGLDPEFSAGDNTQRNEDNGVYPQYKLFQFGIQLEF